jgi:uncharacterized surface protein with fasciclin (FAS1) repeats
MIPEFDQYPIFYFTNHNAIQGPGEIPCMPDHFQKLDFELEAAVVLGKRGRNVKAADVVKISSAKTLNGQSVKIKFGGGKVFINDATVVKADIAAKNGTIHVIDTVLMPK